MLPIFALPPICLLYVLARWLEVWSGIENAILLTRQASLSPIVLRTLQGV